jgi:hypothetical protein
MNRESVQRYFDALCEQRFASMSGEQRRQLQQERTRIATLLAFWPEQPNGSRRRI